MEMYYKHPIIGAQVTDSCAIKGTYMPSLVKKIPGVPMYDGGDRYRTASAKISVGGLDIGMNLHTGMPGTYGNGSYKYHKVDTDGDGILDTWVFYGGDIDDPGKRAGVLYIGIGPLKIGSNSESIRDIFQNGCHNLFDYPEVLVLDKNPEFYWYFGSESGNTRW